MTDFIEAAIEKMIQENIITEEELEKRIEMEKKKSPITKMESDGSSVGMLLSLIMQSNEGSSVILGMALQRIQKLEKDVEELKK